MHCLKLKSALYPKTELYIHHREYPCTKCEVKHSPWICLGRHEYQPPLLEEPYEFGTEGYLKRFCDKHLRVDLSTGKRYHQVFSAVGDGRIRRGFYVLHELSQRPMKGYSQ